MNHDHTLTTTQLKLARDIAGLISGGKLEESFHAVWGTGLSPLQWPILVWGEGDWMISEYTFADFNALAEEKLLRMRPDGGFSFPKGVKGYAPTDRHFSCAVTNLLWTISDGGAVHGGIQRKDTMTQLEKTKIDRFRYLKALYEETQGSSNSYVENPVALGETIGLAAVEATRIDEYLRGEGLVKRLGISGETTITHKGVVEVEAALSQPQKPTEHFPPVINVLNVQNMVNSAIQQGNTQSSQVLTWKAELNEDLKAFIKNLDAQIPNLELAEEKLAEIKADKATLESQLLSSRPKSAIIAESLKSIRSILEETAGNLAAAGLLPIATNLIQSLSQ